MTRIFDGIDDSMVTAYVKVLPRFCQFCGGRCWKVDDYPYACRCSECSAYFHRQLLTCTELAYEGFDLHNCTYYHDMPNLRIFKIADGRLVEVCRGCVKWLRDEGYIEER